MLSVHCKGNIFSSCLSAISGDFLSSSLPRIVSKYSKSKWAIVGIKKRKKNSAWSWSTPWISTGIKIKTGSREGRQAWLCRREWLRWSLVQHLREFAPLKPPPTYPRITLGLMQFQPQNCAVTPRPDSCACSILEERRDKVPNKLPEPLTSSLGSPQPGETLS